MDFRDIVSTEGARRRGNRQADASKSASEASEENVPHRFQGKPEEALREAERITELLPDDANAWYNKGIALSELNRHEEALRSFDEAIRLKPDFPEAWQRKGGCLSELGKYEEALAALEKAPNNYLVWYDRALALGVLRRYDESVEAHKQVIRLKPDGERVLGNIGSLLEAIAIRREELKVNKETGGMRSDETSPHHTDPTNPT